MICPFARYNLFDLFFCLCFVYFRISAHGLVFLYRNLAKTEREQVCRDHPQVNWTLFPPAVDEGGPFYLEQFFNEFCDNSKQDSYHTAAGIKAAIKLFVQTRPWLDEKRRCFLQSDGAVNYHEPTTEVDVHWIGSRCFSEPGEGKDWIDANSAIVKCIMRRCRNKGFFQQNAFQYFVSAEDRVVPGNTNCVIEIDSSKEEKVTLNKLGKQRACVPGIRNFALFAVDDDAGTITFWESLDYLASEASMADGGHAVGYGPGLVLSLKDFNEVHRVRNDVYHGEFVHMGSTASSTRAHKGDDEKKEEKRLKEERKANAANKKRKKNEDETAIKSCEDNGIEYRCPRCKLCFLNDAKLKSHVEKGDCADKTSAIGARRRQRDIKYMLSKMAQDAKEELDNTIKSLGNVRLKFKPGTGGGVGIILEVVEERFIVKSIEEGSLAFKTALVEEGFILKALNGVPPTCINCLDGPFNVQSDGFVVVEFRRPTPPIPPRGYARRGFQKRPKFKMNDEQIKWLEEEYKNMNPTGLRAEGYHKNMFSKFRFRIRHDIDEPFWLYEPQVSEWLKSKKAEIKALKKVNEIKMKEETKKAKKQKPKPKMVAPKKRAKVADSSPSSSSSSEEESDFDEDY